MGAQRSGGSPVTQGQWFEVYSPEMKTWHGDMEPPDYSVDWVCVKADTKRQAVILGVRIMLAKFPTGWCAENRADGRPPWAGIKAELLPEHKPHTEDPDYRDCCDVCGEPWPCGGWGALTGGE